MDPVRQSKISMMKLDIEVKILVFPEKKWKFWQNQWNNKKCDKFKIK